MTYSPACSSSRPLISSWWSGPGWPQAHRAATRSGLDRASGACPAHPVRLRLLRAASGRARAGRPGGRWLADNSTAGKHSGQPIPEPVSPHCQRPSPSTRPQLGSPVSVPSQVPGIRPTPPRRPKVLCASLRDGLRPALTPPRRRRAWPGVRRRGGEPGPRQSRENGCDLRLRCASIPRERGEAMTPVGVWRGDAPC